jgi:hypothetical protein
MLSLTINHNIHITREQRYSLYEGETIETIGVSLPVWLSEEITSEPAKEIFCKYTLRNIKDDEKPIQILEEGYEITLPYRTGKNKKILSDSEWLNLSMNRPDSLFKYYSKRVNDVSCANLLDPEDGGGKCLIYREHNKFQIDNRMLNIVHYVKIGEMEELLDTIY